MVRDYPAISLGRNCLAIEPTQGDCHLRRQFDGEDHWLDVVQADPSVFIADKVLHTIWTVQQHHGKGDTWLATPPGQPLRTPWAHWHDHEFDVEPWPCNGQLVNDSNDSKCWHNWLLHIDGRNRTVIYRIGTYNLQLNAWSASWPD